MPSTPQRAPGPGSVEQSQTGHAPRAGHAPAPAGGLGDGEQTETFTDFFAQALDGAMTLVHADGGEVATLDEARQVLVLRARRTRPRLDVALGPMGTPARHSQPHRASSSGQMSAFAGQAFGASGFTYGSGSLPEDDAGRGAIEIQATQLLPASLRSRTYGRGERLMGQCWQRGEPVLLSDEDCRQLPGGNAPRDPEAAWHLAIPILRAGSLATLLPDPLAREVIGVIAVHNRDSAWPFRPHDVEMLVLHADRVARAMRVAELSQQSQSQVDLLGLLGADPGGSQPQSLYVRLRDAVRRVIDAPSFAVVLSGSAALASAAEVSFELAERDGQAIAPERKPIAALPPWWGVVSVGRTLCVSAPEDRVQHPEYGVLGWGDGPPVQSILAAPLLAGTHVIGALVAGSPHADVYAPEHERLFASFARSAAILIRNAQLTSESSQYRAKTYEKEQQLARLNNAMLTLNASLDLDTTLDALARHAKDLTEAAICAVFLKDGEYLVGRVAGMAGSKQTIRLEGVRISQEQPEVRDLLRSSQYAVLETLECEWAGDEAEGEESEGARLGRQMRRIGSCLVLPVTHQETTKGVGATRAATREQSLGALVVYTPGQRHHFWPEEIGLLSALASQAGGAISNALLYQELQRAYEEQKELDRLKEDFILQVSHEFRTPITAINGYVTLITRHGPKLEQTKLEQFAAEIHQSTGQLMGMISRLHDASSIGNQPLSLASAPVNAHAAAQAALADQAPEAKDHIEVQVPDDLWMLGDAERVKAVFSNLLSNAVKYSPAQRKCVVTVTGAVVEREALVRAGRPHTLKEGAAGRWVVIGVRDEGEGIAPEDQAKLFQKFVRLPRSLTTSVRGTGLGLWICRQYLDAMGGDIWVESAPGKGSLFQFILPLAAAPDGAAP